MNNQNEPRQKSTPWSALESICGQTAVADTWRKHLGSSFNPFKSAFLHPLSEPASSVPCPCGCGCSHEVVRHNSGELVGVCRCERWSCDDLPLTKEDIVLWSLSWTQLGRALCQALGLQSKRTDLYLPATCQIGAWSVGAVPVVLTFQSERVGFTFVIGQLVARLRQPFILLAPTSQHMDANVKELLANVGAGFFDLTSHVEFTATGQLRLRVPPGELFARFTPQPREPVEESAARNAFALIRALDSEQPVSKASVYTVFRLYCMEGLNAVQVARKCRCARSLVFRQLKVLRQKLGTHPRTLRQYSGQFERIEESLADPRARRVHRKTAMYGEGEEEE